ncbi:penicillin-binding transpeptidase domain-containing protein [Kitasatospora sp. NPDC090091]|uniref:penicillin-binding transpeptidase domain-containing protein n=1 Tax=Kitasatospora sp. NPDC090091 TaxID=3364081 RepID=UPI0037FEA438
MRKGAKIGIITGVSLAVLAGGGYGAYSLVGGSDSGAPEAKKPRTVVAEPPTAEQAAAGAKDFLEAWAAGDLGKAAGLTDDPAAATAALTAFKDQVKPSGLTLAPSGPATPAAFASATGTPSPTAKPSAPASASATPSAAGTGSASPSASAAPAGVLMGFKARAEFEGTNRVWDYNGFLSVVKMSDDTPAVHWAPTVIHPHLGPGEVIATQPVFAPPGNVVDRNNKPLQGASITPTLLTTLQDNVRKIQAADPGKDQSDAGSGVVITTADGKGATDKLFTIVEPKPAKPFKVTIDNTLQAAAEKAMADLGGKSGSIVAIEPSTGQVLAFANAPANGQNRAFLGLLAPGSTMKIVTSTALLEAGVNPDTVVPCPVKSSNPKAIPNSFPDAYPNNTLQQDFMISCNTAFIDQGLASLKPGALTSTAKDVYGIGLEWKTGLPNADGRVPDAGANKDEQAMQSIGQGKIQMNPLAIASITATVQSGEFKQPVMVADLPQQKAARNLSPDAAGKLRAMMAATAKDGTAKAVMAGISDNAGAKTGSAEATGVDTTNSWFTAYRGNLALAAEVQGGGHGADAAGPAVAAVIKAAGNR